MLPKKIHFEIVTPDRSLFSGDVDEVYVPGVGGQMGILPGHAPLLSELATGELIYKIEGRREILFCSWGFVEVLPDRVTILAEIGERAEEIDVERALQAKRRAEEKLKSKDPFVDFERAARALEKALLRLRIGGKKADKV